MPNQVQSDSPQQFHCRLEQVTQLLSKIELERDRLRGELLEKDKRINEYEEKIVQYKTQIRQQQWTPAGGGSHGTVVDITVQARIKELELALADQDRDLLAKDVSLKTLEEDKDKAELKAETLETKLTEKEEQLNKLKTKVEECNKSITDLQLELTKANKQIEEGKKSISDFRLNLTEVKTQASQAAFLEKRFKDAEKCCYDQQLEKETLEKELAELKEQSEFDKNNAFTNGMKKAKDDCKAEIDDLEMKIRRKEDEYATLQTTYQVLQEQKKKKDEEFLDVKTGLEMKQKENKMLTEDVQRLEKESEKAALDASSQLVTKEKQIQEITDEKEQIAANLNKNILQLQQQLKETKLEVKQLTEKNTELADLNLKGMVSNNLFQINIVTQWLC